MKTTIDELSNAIAQEMAKYTDEVIAITKKAVDTVADEVNEEIKAHVTFTQRTGDYVKAFRIKTTKDDKYNKTKIWHVVNEQYRKTHLLEKGHALRNGGRARAFPHVIYGDQLAKERMESLVKEGIESAKP